MIQMTNIARVNGLPTFGIIPSPDITDGIAHLHAGLLVKSQCTEGAGLPWRVGIHITTASASVIGCCAFKKLYWLVS